jgi:hypothetical protein
MKQRIVAAIAAGVFCAASSGAGDWSDPIEVRQDETLCLSYQSKVDGGFLIVRAAIAPGWHTFSMDNKARAEEKLAGKPSLGIDRPTEIAVGGGAEVEGPWYQSPPKDFSRPELRWFSWGFEREAVFAARVRPSAGGPARIAIRGQACTETACKNIDVALSVPAPAAAVGASAPGAIKGLVPVR